jgi:hypothetical protein
LVVVVPYCAIVAPESKSLPQIVHLHFAVFRTLYQVLLFLLLLVGLVLGGIAWAGGFSLLLLVFSDIDPVLPRHGLGPIIGIRPNSFLSWWLQPLGLSFRARHFISGTGHVSPFSSFRLFTKVLLNRRKPLLRR